MTETFGLGLALLVTGGLSLFLVLQAALDLLRPKRPPD